ncbi:amidohydrolase family protein [Nocardia sienata]|uniref:amidohydrolase family protein n=1 Tax=Nocardia sienata TaxID=248552 RepID=UPI0007A49508|nr:amidohydrolase family protein [Nocardia sienata]
MSNALMGSIDVHGHFSSGGGPLQVDPNSFEASLFVAPPASSWSVEDALRFMDDRGIATQLLSSASVLPPEQARFDNEFAADVVQQYPQRFGLLANVPMQDSAAALAEIEYAATELSADGFVIATNYDGRYLGDSSFDAAFAELNRRRATVFVHPVHPAGFRAVACGRPGPVLEFTFDTARTIVDAIFAGVFQRYPDMRVILSHGGGALPTVAGRVASAGTMPFVRHDESVTAESIRAQIRRLYYDTAIAGGPESILPVLEVAGADQVVFGTDFPPASPGVIDSTMHALRTGGVLTDKQLAAMRDTTLSLFPALAARLA